MISVQSDAKDREEVRLEINNSIGKRIELQDTTTLQIQDSIRGMADDYDDRYFFEFYFQKMLQIFLHRYQRVILRTTIRT